MGNTVPFEELLKTRDAVISLLSRSLDLPKHEVAEAVNDAGLMKIIDKAAKYDRVLARNRNYQTNRRSGEQA